MPYELEVAQEIGKRDREIEKLREQVEKLTKERDEAVAAVQRLADGQPFDAIVVADTVKRQTKRLEQQLAALAEQNEKMREALLWCYHVSGKVQTSGVVEKLTALPDLASPVLNRIRAEGMRMALQCRHPIYSITDWEDEIRARTKALEGK